MNHQQRFYHCAHCGKIIGVIEDTDVPVFCCGEAMQPMTAKDSNDCPDKKLPYVRTRDHHVSVFVGPAKHGPLEDDDHVGWVYVETNQGGHRKNLCPENRPEVSFVLSDEERARRVFAYCNKHGLWKADLHTEC